MRGCSSVLAVVAAIFVILSLVLLALHLKKRDKCGHNCIIALACVGLLLFATAELIEHAEPNEEGLSDIEFASESLQAAALAVSALAFYLNLGLEARRAGGERAPKPDSPR